MRFLSRFKLTLSFSLLVVIILGLTLVGSLKMTSYAAGVTLPSPQKSTKIPAPYTTPCSTWSILPSPSPGASQNNLTAVLSPLGA